MIFIIFPRVKTIDQKSKPVKKLNKLLCEHEHICFKCDDNKRLYHNILPFSGNMLEYSDFILTL